MRRLPFVLSLGLFVLGLELATGGLSTTLGRLAAGLAAPMGTGGYPVPVPRFLAGVVLLAGGAVMAGALLWARRRGGRVDTMGKACPRCGEETRRIRRTKAQRLLALTADRRITNRTCGKCGWTGLAARP